MRIREVIETINKMKADGIIDRYAIGGAVGAMFYLEPFSTLDVDVFVELHASQGSLVVDPNPIFQYLRDQGYVMEGQYVVLADSPVQFIPPGNPLAEEALNDAVEQKRLKEGDLLLLASVGAGFTVGTVLMRWGLKK